MLSLFKPIPILLMFGAAAVSKDKLLPLLDYTRVVAVQSEVNELSKMLVLDHVAAPDQMPKPEEFSDYVRRSMKTQKEISRDTSQDFWNTAYRVEYFGNTVRVSSAGPDRQFTTSDDIYSTRELY